MAGITLVLSLSACGTDPAVTQFKNDLNTFCESVAELNDSINHIDADAENAPALAMDYLDKLDKSFQDFAEMDFPEDYDYLEPLADEAGAYMTEAVKNYHLAYEGETYDSSTAAYARENSARAFKRVQVILNVLQGNVSSGDAE